MKQEEKTLLRHIRHIASAESIKDFYDERIQKALPTHVSPGSTLIAAIGQHWHPGCLEAVTKMAKATANAGYDICFYEEHDRCYNKFDAIGLMRNMAYMKAIREGWEYLLYVENDVQPKPDALIHLLKHPELPVVSPIIRYADGDPHGQTLPSFRGDLVNRIPFTAEDRIPNPQLMLRGYERAALTLNFVRSLIDGGFADLHHPEFWDLNWVGHSPMADEYHNIVDSISNSLDFLESISGRPIHQAQRADIYAAHEGLHLSYEQAQTRFLKHRERWYNLSTHFPWIGMRTATIDGAHVEFFRGIANPIGIKIGPGMTAEWLQELIAVLNSNNEPGRISLIHRFGAKSIEDKLPDLIRAVRETGSPVLWVCDPMHGNTESTADGTKTRRFDNIVAELESAFRVHKALGSYLGGVHLELTGENVTECTGGARGLTDGDLARAYKSTVDPRLNYEQAMEMAMRIAGLRH